MKENNKVSFADYINTYEKEIQSSIGFIGQDHDFFINVKANIITDVAVAKFSSPDLVNILDVGCGIGLIDHYLSPFFKNLFGVDIESKVIEKARIFNPGVKYEHYDGSNLPFGDNIMDIVFAINVMHHVPPEGWERFSEEMFRVLKPGGWGIVFEHNPLNPLTRLAVHRCEFDRDAVLLYRNKLKSLFTNAGFKKISSSYILFFPFKQKLFRSFEKKLNWLPAGAQYYIIGKKEK